MPRKVEPKREIGITLGEEAIKDAMVLWVRTFHGVNVDAKKIVISTEGGLSATAMAAPRKPEKEKHDEHDAKSADHSRDAVGLSS